MPSLFFPSSSFLNSSVGWGCFEDWSCVCLMLLSVGCLRRPHADSTAREEGWTTQLILCKAVNIRDAIKNRPFWRFDLQSTLPLFLVLSVHILSSLPSWQWRTLSQTCSLLTHCKWLAHQTVSLFFSHVLISKFSGISGHCVLFTHALVSEFGPSQSLPS